MTQVAIVDGGFRILLGLGSKLLGLGVVASLASCLCLGEQLRGIAGIGARRTGRR